MLNENDLELLSAYLDDALNANERADLEARLQTEADLRRELARLRATVDLIKALPTLSAPRDFTLTPRMVRRPSMVTSVLTSTAFSALSAAAAVILLLVGGLLFTQGGQNAPPALSELSRQADQVAQVATQSPVSDGLNAAPEGDFSDSGGASPSVANRLDDEANTATEQALTRNQPEATLAAIAPPALIQTTTAIEPSAADGFLLAAPTATAQPTLLLYAALPTELPQASGAAAVQPANTTAGEMQSAAQAPEEGIAQQQLDQQSTMIAQGQLSVDAASALAATFPFTTATPAATMTQPPSPTRTPLPSETPMPTFTATPISLPPAPATSSASPLAGGVGLIVVAVLLLVVAVVTTFLRRRS